MFINQDELSIYDAESFHKELVKELQNSSFTIDMKNVNKIDISIIQLLIATQKSCIKNSKKFELQNISEELSAIFKSASCDFLLGGIDE